MSGDETDTDSVGNSNVAFYSPPPAAVVPEKNIFKVDPNNVLFIIHRRGFVTCVCGEVIRKHICNLQNIYKDVRIKFDMCSKNESCRFCEDIVQWNYERFMTKDDDGKMYCRQCAKEIEFDKGICHDCFCFFCYAFLDKCVCCKICPRDGPAQCICDES